MEEIEAFRAAAREKEEKLYDQLAQGELVDIEGLTWSNPVMSARTPPATLSNLRLELVAWKVAGGPLRKESLSVTRQVDDEELKGWKAKISGDSLIRIRARLAEENVTGEAYALLEDLVVGEVADDELVALMASRLKPVTQEDKRFGTLTKDRRSGDFEGKATWDGEEVELILEPEDGDELGATLKVAHALWEKQEAWAKELAEVAVEYGLPTKNEHRLEEGEAAMDGETLLSKIGLETIIVSPDKKLCFYFEDGGVFGGHMIEVSGHLDEGITYFNIAG